MLTLSQIDSSAINAGIVGMAELASPDVPLLPSADHQDQPVSARRA
jgi:hypothetical protein